MNNSYKKIELVENLLEPYSNLLNQYFIGYKHHVYRVIYLCCLLEELDEESFEKVVIAAVFHDLGAWTSDGINFEYLEPSVVLANKYLKQIDKYHYSEEVSEMIMMHHKLTSYKNKNLFLVEVFRKADLIDASQGIVKFHVAKESFKNLRRIFPVENFFSTLIKQFRIRHIYVLFGKVFKI